MTGNMFEMDAIGATVLGGTAWRVVGDVSLARLSVPLSLSSRRWHGDDGCQ